MKRSVLFWILVLPILAFGQPIEGPYLVLEGGQGAPLKDVHAKCRGNSLSDVFFVHNLSSVDEVRVASFSFVTHEIVSGPDSLLRQEGWRQQIADVENIPDGSWAAAILSTSGSYTTLWALIATPDETTATELDHAFCSGEWCSWLQAENISSRAGGGWLVNWIYGDIIYIYYEQEFSPKVAFFHTAVAETTCSVYSGTCLFGPSATRTLSLSTDTVLILLSGNEDFPWLDGSVLKVVSRTGPAYPCDPWEGEAMLPCTWSNLDFRRTRGGRLLVFSGIDDPYYPQYPHPRIVEVNTTGNCLELCTLPLDRDPDAIAWHPDYGFAALSVHPARIMLARIDTNGVEVQPLGIFWEPTDGNRIAEANISITDSGRIVVLWVELDETNAAVLKIGAVGWDTFLDIEKSRAKAMPEKITLSAYPNPFNMTATISFDLPHAEKTSLVVYDVTGRRVRELDAGFYKAGSHQLRFDGSGLASGIYFVRLEAGGLTISQKLLLLK